MFLTNVLSKKVKSKYVIVLMKSMVSDHVFVRSRERKGDKLEYIRFDPHVRMPVVYRELKKIRGVS